MASWFPASEMTRRALQKLPASDLAAELTVTGRDLAAHGHDARAALERPAFERTIVDVHVLRLRGNLSAIIRVEYHEVGIGPRLNRTFARKKIEQLRDLRARDLHERVQIDFPSLHAVRVEEIHALLQRGNAV